MTQKIFNTDNADDMALLWSILPDDVNRITLDNLEKRTATAVFDCGVGHSINANLIAINWHDKTEITRPIQEATEADIGKLCKFWNNAGLHAFGVLSNIYNGENDNYKMSYGGYWEHCRRLTKQEIEELC